MSEIDTKTVTLRVIQPLTPEIELLTKQNLTASKIDVLRHFPFVSFMVMSSRYKIDPNIPTCAASIYNGPTIHIGPKFFNETLKDEFERNFVLLHEVLHIFLEHLGRQTALNYNHKLWNIATDFCINSYLTEMKSEILKFPTFGGLYDVKYKGMSSDEIYHKILEENDNDVQKALSQYGGVGDPDGAWDEIPWDELTDAQKADLKAGIAASIRGHKSIGNGGADALVDALNELIAPSVDWKAYLRDCIDSSSRHVQTYSKWNRRSGRVIFPAQTGNHINLVFGVDTSGSMSNEDLGEALSELRSIMESFDSWSMKLISCDSVAHLIGEYESEEGDDFSSVNKQLIGGGGTDMQPMVSFAEDFGDTPNALVIVTDGYIPKCVGSSTIPTFVVITRNGNRHVDCVTDAQVITIK